MIGAISLPVFLLCPFNPIAVILMAGLIITGCWIGGRWIQLPDKQPSGSLSWLWIVAAAGLSLIPAYAVSPHFFHHGIGFGAPIFDHEKVVIIDEMVRNGTPVRNPFLTKAGSSPYLNYYYGWYFLAAQASLLSGCNGWATDIVFTGVTAFLSLILMGWAALRFSGRNSSTWLVLLFSLLSSMTPFLSFVLGQRGNEILAPEHPLETWIIQSAWVPQHLFSATTACLALILFVRLVQDSAFTPVVSVVSGLLVAFSYHCSVWVGLTGLLPVIFAIVLMSFSRTKNKSYYSNIFLSGFVSLAAVAPIAMQQAHRMKSGKIIATWIYPVFSSSHSRSSDILNFIGYWTVLIPVYFGIIYLLSILWVWYRRSVHAPWSLKEKSIVAACFLPLLVAQILHSVISTNDLGWRCVLISVMAMTIVSARILSQHTRKTCVLIVSIIALMPALLTGLSFAVGITATQILYGSPNEESERMLSVDKDMWKAVADVTPNKEAVAFNPTYEEHLTLWEGSISWAMLSNRNTCTPGWLYLNAFASDTTKDEIVIISDRIHRVFGSDTRADDFRILRDEYNCRTLLVVPSDGLWHLPLTTPSPYFDLVQENPGKWRIYRAHGEK